MINEQLEVSSNNLYANGVATYFPEENELLLTREIITFTPSSDDERHTLKQGERLDQIAWQYYKDVVFDPSKLWWVIADANLIFNPYDLKDYIGTELLIPDHKQVKLST